MTTYLRNIVRMMMVCVLVSLVALPALAKNNRTTYTFTVSRTLSQTEPTACTMHPNVAKSVLGVSSLQIGDNLKFFAIQQTSGKFYSTITYQPYGHYFNAQGNVVAASNKKKIAFSSLFDGSDTFQIGHVDTNVTDGETYTIAQAWVNTATADTLVYQFHITIGQSESVSSDEPTVIHRPDVIDSWLVAPYVRQNEQEPEALNFIQVNAGDQITLGLRAPNEGDKLNFLVKNPQGKQVKASNAKDYVLTAAEPSDAGVYYLTARYTPAGGKLKVATYQIYVDVQTNQGEYYDWDANGPKWSYDFRDEYESIPQPTKTFKFTQHNGKAAHMMEGDWWSVYWGDNLNTEVWDGKSGETVEGDRKHAMTNILKKFDEDYAYIRNEMGWPPDLAAREGYKSFIYVFGSGINRDNTANTEAGGYQGYTQPDNANHGYACVYASYYPMSRFRDDADSKWNDGEYQREAMIHEGIHAIFADYPGCKKSAWFQEAGNVWLQGAMNAKRGLGAQVSGWLGVGNLICPFMPIECYSGWLQDGSFGGPAAEGVNMYGPTGQVCTWRNLIGGVQYGETFPIFLGLNVGYGSVPWIWRYCTDYVLKGIAEGNAAEGVEGIGDEGMRQLILHYRAKLATMDFKESSKGMRSLLDGSFGAVVRPEWRNGVYDPTTNTVTGRNSSNDQMPCWIDCEPFTLTPYQVITLNDEKGWYAPDTLTNPGWSGGNIIPVHVTGDGCEIIFRPEDTNMRAQLCYRTKSGATYYSQPVTCGKMVLNWTSANRPANDVVFAVVCNTDYIYTGEAQRKHHYDYRLKLGKGALAPASTRVKWYMYEQNLKDTDFETAVKNPLATADDGQIRLMSTVFRGGQKVQFDLGGKSADNIVAHLVGVAGVLIDRQPMAADGTVQLPAGLRKGLYILSVREGKNTQAFKIFIE